MVTIFHRLGRFLAVLLVLSCLCQCTTREVKSTRSSFSFAGGGDEGKIRQKFAESGYSIGEDGNIQADNPNLFAGDKPYGVERDFQTKNALFRKSKVTTKEFTTPEYIQRQEFRGTKETSDLEIAARETGVSESRQSGRLFKSRSRNAGEYGSYQTGPLEGSTRSFRTGSDRVSSAYDNAVVAEGVRQSAGYKQNAALSMTDVKKLVSPGTYARATGIE